MEGGLESGGLSEGGDAQAEIRSRWTRCEGWVC